MKPYPKATKPHEPPPYAVPAHYTIPLRLSIWSPGDLTTALRPSRWKGTRDLMTVAAAFAADLPEDVEVPRVGVFAIPSALSANDAPCCDTEPEVTNTAAKSDTSCTTTKGDAACTVTKAESSGTTSESKAPANPKTWTFAISIGGSNPLQIKGTITEGGADQPAAAKP